ncbi:MAG: hypothetical protein ACK4RK_22335, partial [Gemmataceae bacterium]
MTTLRRFEALAVILTLAVLYSTAHLWGEPARNTDKDKILSGHWQPPPNASEATIDEALAASKFSQQPVVTYRSQADELL